MHKATKYRRLATAVIFIGSLVSVMIAATQVRAEGIRSERVQFAKGTSGAVIKGRLKGREVVDYKLGARAGQNMIVDFETSHTANYFNILAPGETDVAFFIGSLDGGRFEGELPANGDYTIRVYLMRSAARRAESADYRLKVSIGAKTNRPATENSQDARVPGTGFHATGKIPCSMAGGQPTGSCPFGVKREGDGSAMVTVNKSDGRTRVIFFQRGQATGYDVNQADPGAFSADKQRDLNIIHIGEERYEIPDAVIDGG
jgi:hypothetical protein